MLLISFFELLDIYLKGAKDLAPQIFGLQAFSEAEFALKDYELVGDVADFHFYEKAHEVAYHKINLTVVFKYYFNAGEGLGSGLSVAGSARLTTVLKNLMMTSACGKMDEGRLKVFLSEDNREGALTIDDCMVLRFNQWDCRSAYVVSTVELDFPKSSNYGQVATRAVKDTFDLVDLKEIRARVDEKKAHRALRRLFESLTRKAES